MDYVTVAALANVVINHRLLYKGERRVVLRGIAEQVMREYPGRLVIVIPVEPPEPPAPDAEPQAIEQPAPGPIHGDLPAEPDDRPRLSDVARPASAPPRPPRKPKA